MAIQSFADRATRVFFETGKPGNVGWAKVGSIVRRKLDMIHYAAKLNDLKVPPGNRLEALSRDLEGKHSIRVNDQWRVVFRWTESEPTEVEIADYH